jgi:AcrR family transcriptional regulator
VLDAALGIAVADGVSAVTIGAVAQRLGVTRPVVYSCFGDRVELIEALVDREAEQVLTGAVAALHSSGGDDPQAAFVDGFQAFLRTVAERPDAWRLLFAAEPDPAVVERFRSTRLVLAESVSHWIGPAVKSWWRPRGLARKLPVLVEMFMSCCEAAARTLLDPASTWTPDELGELYGRMTCAAMSAA